MFKISKMISEILEFSAYIWNQREKCIKMSPNMLSIDTTFFFKYYAVTFYNLEITNYLLLSNTNGRVLKVLKSGLEHRLVNSA